VANEDAGRSLLWPGVLVGVGVAGSLDQIVLHQLLRWHHFYDRGSQAAGLIADGIFHLGSIVALVAGLVPLVRRLNLYDGVVQHKLLGLHQVRAGAPRNLPYDVAFIAVAVAVLLAGLLLLRAGGHASASGASASASASASGVRHGRSKRNTRNPSP
jgi:uncharacterized membrane protein